MPIATFWRVTLRAFQDWWNDNCLRLAASLAYYTALSLAPLILLIVGVVGLVLDRQQVGSQLSAQLEGLIGPAGRDLVTSILAATNPQGGTLATVIGLITLPIGATAVFGELQATLNLVWEVRPAPTIGVWAGIGPCSGSASFRWPGLGPRVLAPRLARHQRHPGGGRRRVARPRAGPPESPVRTWRVTRGPDLRVCPALGVRTRCRDRLAGRVARWAHHRGPLYPRQDGHRLLPGPSQRGLSLRGGGLLDSPPGVGVLLSLDHVLWRRVYACLDHTASRGYPGATCHPRRRTPTKSDAAIEHLGS